ncbi:hypothetical protein [Streptomyces sp. NBC_01207]|uniref:hypothetical protein n=1 Tax=Streptomyces sp. NBC_01207 TaxID=2903772 RepID=UPI002E0FAE0A|nr:hypothetical protein OG457_48840 [Streptomyces sp. NBC_01207]
MRLVVAFLPVPHSWDTLDSARRVARHFSVMFMAFGVVRRLNVGNGVKIRWR